MKKLRFATAGLILAGCFFAGCIRLNAGAGYTRQDPQTGEPVTRSVGVDTNQLVPDSLKPVPGKIEMAEQ